MSLKVQITNGVQSLKEGDTATEIKMLLIEGNGTIYDYTGKDAKFVVSNRVGKLFERPVVSTEKIGEVVFSFEEGEVTGSGQMFLEIHIDTGAETKIFPSSEYLVVSIDKSLNIIGQTITSYQYEQLRTDVALDIGLDIEQLNNNIDSIISDVTGELKTEIIDSAKIVWKIPVANFSALATTYPGAVEGDTAMARDTGKVYRFDGSAWIEIQEIDATAINEVDSRLTSKLVEITKLDIKSFGAKGDGVTNDTQAFIDAFTWANGYMYTGIGTNKYTGAEITISDGVYNLSTLSAPIDIKCNVKSKSAEVIIPASYASTVFNVGVTTTADVLVGAKIELPKIKATGIVSGSIGVKLNHLNTCKIHLDAITLFETGLYLTGVSQGTTYCEIHLGLLATCKRSIVLKPGSNGWANSNQFIGGSISQSPSYAGGARVSGWKHILMDGRSPATAIVGNTFVGLSMEGNASEYLVEAYNAYSNTWYGTYHETGAPYQSVTLSGDTFTQTGHGRIVGDLIAFQASSSPGGMHLGVAYYITEVTANTFKVSQNKGGTNITFTTSGSGVTYILAARCLFDSTSGNTFKNRFDRTFTPPSILIDFIEIGSGAYDNGRNDDFFAKSSYSPEDVPIYRARNTTNLASSRPAFAAYPSTSNPASNPKLWSTAIGDRGLLFASNGAETGRVYNNGGVMSYQKAGEIGYELASSRRSPGLISITSLSLAANATTYIDVTLTDASVNDHLLVTPVGLLPTGVVYSHAYVVSANTLRVVFYNFTAGSISLSTNVQAIVFRRYY